MIKQEEIFRDIKIKIVHNVSFIDKNPYLTNILSQSKQKDRAHQVFYNLNNNFL